MIFTLYYMYATLVQWWRLTSLRHKLAGTLGPQSALIVCQRKHLAYGKDRNTCLENLLFHDNDKLGCTVVPKRTLSLKNYIRLPNSLKYFPIHVDDNEVAYKPPIVHILLVADLNNYSYGHEADSIQVETLGYPIGWNAESNLSIIVKSDLNGLTKLIACFSKRNVIINYGLELLKVETIDIEDQPLTINYENALNRERKLKYTVAPKQWNTFVTMVRGLSSKIDPSHKPTAKKHNAVVGKSSVDHSKTDDATQVGKKVPVSEVKPIKKEPLLKTEYGRHLDTIKRGHRGDKSDAHKKRSKPTTTVAVDATTIKIEVDEPTKTPVVVDDVDEEPHCSYRNASSNEVHCEINGKPLGVTDDNVGGEWDKRHRTKTKRKESSHASYDRNKTKIKVELTKPKHLDLKTKDKDDVKGKSVKTKVKKFDVVESPTEVERQQARRSPIVVGDEATAVAHKSVPKKAEIKDIADIKKDKMSILVKRRSLKQMKPPNVLVYGDSTNAKENVKRVLQSVLNKDKYTVYDLPVVGASLSGSQPTSPILWMDSATLLVVCGAVAPHLIPQFLQYLVTGGHLLCLCSDLLYSILHTFTTAEVREHELVRFSYGDWNQIRMMHHIFCYQASPAKKQFSKDSESGSQSHSNGSSPIAPPRTPNTVDIQHNGKTYTIQVQVLGTEETWQTPSLLLASVKNTQGKAIFSQVHLEIDPTQYEYDETTYTALQDSNEARLEILKHLLTNHLGIDCCNAPTVPDETTYTSGYFLGRHDSKQDMLRTNDNVTTDGLLRLDTVTVHFCGKDVELPSASSTVLPVLIHSCPANFSTVQYFEHLQTEAIGRLAVYCDLITSSQHLLGKKLGHGFAVLARQQTQGTGRGGNVWLSPTGCAMFSVQLHIPLRSNLGRCVPLVQHLVMVAVVSAVRSQAGYEHVELGIKWPNDLYAGGKVKIGGLITSTVMEGDLAVCNVGTGVNLSNTSPTTCVNSLIDQHNQLNKTQLPLFTYEMFLALVFNELERLLNIVQQDNVQHMFDLYYKYWLHGDADITVFNRDNVPRKVKVTGIDEYGYMTVQSAEGTVSSVQPDGNTFDMLRGLIAPKLN